MKHCIIIFLIAFASQAYSQESLQYQNLSYTELDSMIDMNGQLRKFDDAIFLSEVLINKAQKENIDTLIANGLNYQGIFYRLLGDYDQSLILLTNARDIRKNTLGADHPSYATSLHNIADLYKDIGSYDKALTFFTQAISIRKRMLGEKHPDYAESINNLASLYGQLGEFGKALPLYLKTLEIDELVYGKEHPYYAISLNNIGGIYFRMGNQDKALPLFLQAKAVKEKVYGTEHPSYAISLNNLAFIYHSMGEYDKALTLLTEALNIKEKLVGKEHRSYAVSMNNLARIHIKLGNYSQALAMHLEALKIEEKVLGEEHPDYATSLSNVALLYQRIGDYNKAYSFFLRSNEIVEKTHNKEHWITAYSHSILAELLFSLGDFKRGWNELAKAINSATNTDFPLTFDGIWFDQMLNATYPSNLNLEKMVECLAIAYRHLQKDSSILAVREKQMLVADLSNALLIKTRNQVTNESDKLRILSLSNEWLLRSLDILNPKIEADMAFNLADKNKSVLLLEATKSELAYRLGEISDSLVWHRKELLGKQSQLQAKLLEKNTKEVQDSLRDNLITVQQNIDEFVEIIARKYPKYHSLEYQQKDVEVKDVQELLGKNTALLEYVIGDSVVHIFYIDQNRMQWSKAFVANEELNERIRTLHDNLNDFELKESNLEYTQNAYWFYKHLVAPVLNDKPDINNLIIVTDGELGHLPFETFLTEESTDDFVDYRDLSYMLNDYTISYNYSATLWKENIEAHTPRNNGQILAVAANYNVMLDSAMVDVRLPTDQLTRSELLPLPSARYEVEILQSKFKGFFAFDTLASESEVKRRAMDYSILHFATHGILDNDRPMLSALAFTEDNDSTESNFWQAHEISKTQLNADLVVLSACETGFGKFQKGNGIASLARAFMYAGVPALVVSLWKVDDNSTSNLMQYFYDNLDSGMRKDEALRKAKLKYISLADESLSNPAYWAPFTMIGKTDVINIKRKNDSMIWWWVGAGMLTLLVIGNFIRRKRTV